MAAWAFANQPAPEPPWPSRIQGFSLQPFQKDPDAIERDEPTTQQVDSDLKLLAGKTNSVRTCSTLGTLGEIPRLEEACPGRPVVIGGVGWPSDGRTRESAVASTSNQALFLWRFLDHARQQKLEFSAPLVRVPNWQVLAASSVITAAILVSLFHFHSRTLRNRGRRDARRHDRRHRGTARRSA